MSKVLEASQQGKQARRMVGHPGLLLPRLRIQRQLVPGGRHRAQGGRRGETLSSEAGFEGPGLVTKALVAVFAALILLTLALIVLSFPVGVYTFFYTSLSGNYTAAYQIGGVYVYVGPQVILIPFNSSLGAVFFALIVVYAGMVALAATEGKRLTAALASTFREGFSGFFSNRLLVAVISIGFLVFTIGILDIFITSAGVPVGGISGDTLNLFFTLTIAPLREEFGFRFVMIGLLAAVACVGRPWKSLPSALWRPASLTENRPRELAVTGLLVAGLAISSITFGLVHILSGSGWQIGKLPEAAYAGLVLGYLYIRYGFHVAVLAHWGVDYLGTVYAFFGQGAYGIPYASDPGYVLQQVVSVDLLVLFGFGCFLVVMYAGLRTWFGSKMPGQASAQV